MVSKRGCATALPELRKVMPTVAAGHGGLGRVHRGLPVADCFSMAFEQPACCARAPSELAAAKRFAYS